MMCSKIETLDMGIFDLFARKDLDGFLSGWMRRVPRFAGAIRWRSC